MPSEERFIDLEMRISFQEDAIQKISDAVFEQQKQIRDMTDKIERMEQFIRSMTPSLNAQEHEETPPPHY